jgi:hypothetical protein
VPSAAFRRKAIGREGNVIPHFTTVTWDGVVYNCVAFHKPDEKARRNATAMILYKQALAWDDRKTKPIDLTGPVLILYGDDEFMSQARPQ